MCDFGSCLHGPHNKGKVVSNDHIHRPSHVGRFKNPQIILAFLFPLVEVSDKKVQFFFEVIGPHEEFSIAEHCLDGVGQIMLHDNAALEGELV